MSFHNSCRDIHLAFENDSTMLCCVARDCQGAIHHRKICLDVHIGNTDGYPHRSGWFIWGGENFTESAHDIRLEHTDRGPKLTAQLRMANGGYRERQGIFLADKIANEDGHLRFLGP
ncbi:CVNH domain-containing protein [Aspergillus saccharolyticus JOP 1030-1]|uniref:Cyanovirin-N n=1 Tax=Aspergillus saccharolyticus JOP 1030-1 TaxID=1450539 RepID=A0A318ZF51_9EURO|nr:Cyanovirin-N [Aspergillus saccharolyticus JOP 1030-1]PYH46049.1 Cyanovirin-N [Aspergillus saccharolyticus JOP 1030-1]